MPKVDEKRAQSQHQGTRKAKIAVTQPKSPTSDQELHEEIQKLKDKMQNNYIQNTQYLQNKQSKQPEEAKEFLETEFTFQDQFGSNKKEVAGGESQQVQQVAIFQGNY